MGLAPILVAHDGSRPPSRTALAEPDGGKPHPYSRVNYAMMGAFPPGLRKKRSVSNNRASCPNTIE